MAINKQLSDAIKLAVKDAKQPEAVANKLLGWLKDASEKKLDAQEKQEHLENVLPHIRVDKA